MHSQHSDNQASVSAAQPKAPLAVNGPADVLDSLLAEHDKRGIIDWPQYLREVRDRLQIESGKATEQQSTQAEWDKERQALEAENARLKAELENRAIYDGDGTALSRLNAMSRADGMQWAQTVFMTHPLKIAQDRVVEAINELRREARGMKKGGDHPDSRQ